MPDTIKHVWEPACGDGAISTLFGGAGYTVTATDIASGADYFTAPPITCDAIITNPPYGLRGKTADRFIERSLEHMRAGHVAWIALLLPQPQDCAKGRSHLFGDCRECRMKVTLCTRIVWFDRRDVDPKAKKMSPKDNHAWFAWTRDNTRPPNG